MKPLQSAVALLVIALTGGEAHAELVTHCQFEEVLKPTRSHSAAVGGESLPRVLTSASGRELPLHGSELDRISPVR
jgi:hypothetical protein